MNKQHPILLFVLLALLATAPFTNVQGQQPSEEQVARILKRFPEADKDKDGKLSTEEIEAVRQMFQSRQRNRRSPAAAGPTQAGDAKLAETLAGMNARFTNVEVELLEWPDELHNKLGEMTKLALVTGGQRGIGFGIAQALVADGFKVAVASRSAISSSEDIWTLARDLQQQDSKNKKGKKFRMNFGYYFFKDKD